MYTEIRALMDIQKFIPHRGHVLCLNRVQDTIQYPMFDIPADHIYIISGFFSTSGVLEFMAQSVAFVLAYKFPEVNAIPVVAAIKNFELTKHPMAEDRLKCSFNRIDIYNQMISVELEVLCNEQSIANAQVIVSQINQNDINGKD